MKHTAVTFQDYYQTLGVPRGATQETRTGWPDHTHDLHNTYFYDGNGNRIAIVRNRVSSVYQYDHNDKLLSGDGFLFDNYDGNGSPGLIFAPPFGWMHLSYDDENRLTQILYARSLTYPNGLFNSFVYDGDGTRVEKTDSFGETIYVYDGDIRMAEAAPNGAIRTYYTPGVGFASPTGWGARRR